jgi:hypothetical protein
VATGQVEDAGAVGVIAKKSDAAEPAVIVNHEMFSAAVGAILSAGWASADSFAASRLNLFESLKVKHGLQTPKKVSSHSRRIIIFAPTRADLIFRD